MDYWYIFAAVVIILLIFMYHIFVDKLGEFMESGQNISSNIVGVYEVAPIRPIGQKRAEMVRIYKKNGKYLLHIIYNDNSFEKLPVTYHSGNIYASCTSKLEGGIFNPDPQSCKYYLNSDNGIVWIRNPSLKTYEYKIINKLA